MLAAQPDATWGIDFARGDGTAGFLRLVRLGDRCWCWAYLVGPELGLVVVRDHDVAPPRRPGLLDVRADALWMELVCETPGEHWTFGLEAFAVRLEHPRDALRGEIGERLPMGIDLEWETDGTGPGSTGSVHGELLVGDARIELEAVGVLRNSLAPETAWPSEWVGSCRLADGRWVRPVVVATERSDAGVWVPTRAEAGDGGAYPLQVLSTVPIPLLAGGESAAPVLVRVLARVRGGEGWLEVLQSGVPA